MDTKIIDAIIGKPDMDEEFRSQTIAMCSSGAKFGVQDSEAGKDRNYIYLWQESCLLMLKDKRDMVYTGGDPRKTRRFLRELGAKDDESATVRGEVAAALKQQKHRSICEDDSSIVPQRKAILQCILFFPLN